MLSPAHKAPVVERGYTRVLSCLTHGPSEVWGQENARRGKGWPVHWASVNLSVVSRWAGYSHPPHLVRKSPVPTSLKVAGPPLPRRWSPPHSLDIPPHTLSAASPPRLPSGCLPPPGTLPLPGWARPLHKCPAHLGNNVCMTLMPLGTTPYFSSLLPNL